MSLIEWETDGLARLQAANMSDKTFVEGGDTGSQAAGQLVNKIYKFTILSFDTE